MSIHLIRDLESLHRDILSMCAMVEEMVHSAIDELGEPDNRLAAQLARRDDEIDRCDVRIEEECLKILALHQPVAIDLRRIAAVLKITGELERVADLGVNIAERVSALADGPQIVIPEKLKVMARLSLDMLHRSIDAYVSLDSPMARQVSGEDDRIDQMNREIIDELAAVMKSSPDLVEPALHLFSASRHVERIADHATNIAEDVVYLVEGAIIRHRKPSPGGGILTFVEPMSKPTVLIIEDERSLVDVLTYNLVNEGFEVLSATDGQDGLRRAQRSLPDLVILDLNLPVIDGLAVCRQLRSDPRTQGVRVLMLTARSEEVDEIVGFNMGADDYVTKPFKIKPLIHRIKALLRRPPVDQASADRISLHGIEIDRVNHTARAEGAELQLTPTEFKILWTLARQPGRPFTRNELMDVSRGEDANALERTIDVHIRSLRQKLGTLGEVVETVRGIGYRFRPERDGA